jgi:hypothetical protein
VYSRASALLTTILLLISLQVGALAGKQATPVARITTESLLREMIDMERLAQAPAPGLQCDQFSSYDRASVAPDKEGWFANGDAGQFIRAEEHAGRTEYVMADMAGPGAIVNIWSANAGDGGTIRIYIDDMDKPALETSFTALTCGGMPEFPAPFSQWLSGGSNLYFPLPYQQHCKVTLEKPQPYYHLDYRTYPKGTQVEPFSLAALAKVSEVIKAVGAVLAQPDARFNTKAARLLVQKSEIQPGQQVNLFDLVGPAAIVRMEVNVDAPKEQLAELMRGAMLTINFDREKNASVIAPLGDFFGSTPGLNPCTSLPAGIQQDGTCYANWYMPFANNAKITVRNDATVPLKLRFAIWTKSTPWQNDNLYFHAKWRRQWFTPPPDNLDWTILQAQGRGRFVGLALGVTNTTPGWWGEGDEKIWVDDDNFPSWFGTGSEDYFGYAWCSTELYTHAYHNQSIVTGPGNLGYSAEVRYHIIDDIPFAKHIKFDFEKLSGAPDGYSAVAYWYANPGATDTFKPVPADQHQVWLWQHPPKQ